MKWAASGTRPPPDDFAPHEVRYMCSVLLNYLDPGDEFGCGGCVGVDAELFDAVVRYNDMLARPVRLVLWLPANKRQVVHRLIELADEVHDDGWGYLERDQLLVDWCDRMLAFPLHEEARQPRSGTWATVRMARRAYKLRQALVLRPAPAET